MATWPTRAELKARLDITSDDWDSQLDRMLAASIGQIKAAVGTWHEGFDSPDEALSQAALELAVEYGSTGEASTNPKSRALLYGKRRRFGTA